MWRHYVYIHRKADAGQPFYVGKGTVRARCKTQQCERAYATGSRSEWWRRTVAKHGLAVEIVASFRTDAGAQAFEKRLIREIGKENLCNLTDGGDGHAGLEASALLRAKRSANAKRPRSEAWVKSIRRSRKNGGNGGVVKRGDKLSEEWRQNIAKTKIGKDNPMFGRTGEKHPTAKAVVDDATGAQYPSVTAAAKAAGMRMQTLHNQLTGHRPNTTTMRLV